MHALYKTRRSIHNDTTVSRTGKGSLTPNPHITHNQTLQHTHPIKKRHASHTSIYVNATQTPRYARLLTTSHHHLTKPSPPLPHIHHLQRRTPQLNHMPRLQRLRINILDLMRMEDTRFIAAKNRLFTGRIRKPEAAPSVHAISISNRPGPESINKQGKEGKRKTRTQATCSAHKQSRYSPPS